MIVRVAIATGRSIDEVRHYDPALLRTIIEEIQSGSAS